MKKAGIAILIVMIVSLTAFTAFSAEKKSFLQGSEDEVYYMVPFVSGVEYWFPVYEMFKQAGQQLGVKTKYLGTPEYDVNRHLAVFEQVLALLRSLKSGRSTAEALAECYDGMTLESLDAQWRRAVLGPDSQDRSP